MQTKLANNELEITIESMGAELKSVRHSDHEYMWNGDPKFWGRTSPVLFPFVGAVTGGEYRHDGKAYKMGQHGFARDMEFELQNIGKNKVTYKLTSDEDTLKKYPFPFALTIGYELKENSLTVSWKVENTGDEELHFAIGAHPAFMCKTDENGTLKGNYLGFDGKKVIKVRKFGDGLVQDGTYDLETDEEGRIALDEHTFDNGALILENGQVDKISLADSEGHEFVKMTFSAPLIGIWSPEGKNAPFVCLEPWYGRADAAGFTGDLKDREYEQHLAPNGVFETEYTVTFD